MFCFIEVWCLIFWHIAVVLTELFPAFTRLLKPAAKWKFKECIFNKTRGILPSMSEIINSFHEFLLGAETLKLSQSERGCIKSKYAHAFWLWWIIAMCKYSDFKQLSFPCQEDISGKSWLSILYFTYSTIGGNLKL